MDKPAIKPWAHVVTLWYEHCPGAEEAKRKALLENDLEAMKRIASMANPIVDEIGDLSVQIVTLEAKRDSLSKLYKDLEKQFNDHSDSYDSHFKKK